MVRTGTVADDIAAQVIEQQLLATKGQNEYGFYSQFSKLCINTEACEGLPFMPMAMRNADLLTRQTAYDAFTRLPDDLFDRWWKAYRSVNADPSIKVTDYEDGADPK